MNKEYVYKDGQALIIDENNNQKTVDYYDNLDEVLVQENFIEAMENEIKDLEKEVSQFENESKGSKLFGILLPFLLFSSFPLITVPILGKFYGLNNSTDLAIFFSSFFAPAGALGSLKEYSSQKDGEKRKNGKRVQLESLIKALEEEKEYLDELKKDKTNSNDKEGFHINEIDSSNELDDLDDFLSFCFDLGYNEDKYFKYYQDGDLDKRLEKKFNDAGIEYANEYFKEKAPLLSKKKKNKNRTK